MAVIKEYMNGPCKITVYDDCIQPPEEVEKIIERVSRIVLQEDFRRQHEMRQKQQEGTV